MSWYLFDREFYTGPFTTSDGALAHRQRFGPAESLLIRRADTSQPTAVIPPHQPLHDVTIETDMDGEMLLACSCGATSNIDGYAIDLDAANDWAASHPFLPPLPSE